MNSIEIKAMIEEAAKAIDPGAWAANAYHLEALIKRRNKARNSASAAAISIIRACVEEAKKVVDEHQDNILISTAEMKICANTDVLISTAKMKIGANTVAYRLRQIADELEKNKW